MFFLLLARVLLFASVKRFSVSRMRDFKVMLVKTVFMLKHLEAMKPQQKNYIVIYRSNQRKGTCVGISTEPRKNVNCTISPQILYMMRSVIKQTSLNLFRTFYMGKNRFFSTIFPIQKHHLCLLLLDQKFSFFQCVLVYTEPTKIWREKSTKLIKILVLMLPELVFWCIRKAQKYF